MKGVGTFNRVYSREAFLFNSKNSDNSIRTFPQKRFLMKKGI